MGRGGHSDDEGTPYDQRLEEVEFMRSACAAAQRGDIDKLRDMLDRRPDIVRDDGISGDSGYTAALRREGGPRRVRVAVAGAWSEREQRDEGGGRDAAASSGVHRAGAMRRDVARRRRRSARRRCRRGERAAQGEREGTPRRGEGAARREGRWRRGGTAGQERDDAGGARG